MNLTKKLINLIKQYIDEFKTIKEEYKQKRVAISLYEELIEALNNYENEENKIFISILLNSIYGNNIYVDEFYRIKYLPKKEEELKKFIDKIINEYNDLKIDTQNLKQRISRNQGIISSAHRVIASLKYQTQISQSQNDISNIKRIINYYEISGVISNHEELLLINEIELHNRKIATKRASNEEKVYTENLYNEIPNILTIGFEQFEPIDVSKDKKNTLDKFVKEIISLINYLGVDEINNIIESYQKYNLETNEYNYMIIKVLDNYLEELLTLYQLLIDKEIYTNRAERNEVIKNYYEVLEKYVTIINYYKKLNEFIPEQENEHNEEENLESQEEKKLIYSRSEVNITKAKIISDMDDVPNEYYDTVNDLLTRFKNGTINKKEFKTLTNKKSFKGYSELKYDQVRIILKHIHDNVYAVLGVFAKKTNNDMNMYERIINRTIPKIDTKSKLETQLELTKITEEELEKIFKEKARKGTR